MKSAVLRQGRNRIDRIKQSKTQRSKRPEDRAKDDTDRMQDYPYSLHPCL